MLHPHGTLVGGQSTPIFSPFRSKFGSFSIIPSYLCVQVFERRQTSPAYHPRALPRVGDIFDCKNILALVFVVEGVFKYQRQAFKVGQTCQGSGACVIARELAE